MKRLFLSIYAWVVGMFLLTLLFIVMLLLLVLLFPFDQDRKILHKQCFWWSDLMIRWNPFFKLKTYGIEGLDPNRAHVIVANHQSLADIVVLYQIRLQFKWMAKDSLFKVPILGWCLMFTKNIRIERGKFAASKRATNEAGAWLRKNISVLIFPEGTRGETVRLLPFQNGAFRLAIRERCPILPIAISGTGELMPKGNFFIGRDSKVCVKILPPIETSEYAYGDFKYLKEKVHAAIQSALDGPCS